MDRGDVEIRLAGRVLRLRPTWGAMREIESQLKSSCFTLLQMLARQEMHLSEMAVVVYHGMIEAGEAAADYEAVAKRIFESGVGSDEIRDAVAEYLMELTWAPDDLKKKAAGEQWAANREIISQTFSQQPTGSDGDPETSGDQPSENSGQSSPQTSKNPSG